MGLKPNWKPEEYKYLQDKWGSTSLKGIAAHLGRSESAVLIKVKKLRLGAFLDNGEYITLNQLMAALGRGSVNTYHLTSWVKNRGLPIKSKRVNNHSFRIIYLEDFWKWAEKNRTFIDFSKVEKNSLGGEPDWVTKQRRADLLKASSYKNTPWTTAEDALLRDLLKQHRYGYLELSQRIGRTSGAIQRRVLDLGIKERPVKADNHMEWTAEEFQQLGQMIKNGCSYDLMAEHLKKSSKALRGKVFSVYFTERLDKVIQLMGDEDFGDGRPIPTVHQYRRRIQVKNDLQTLAELLLLRRNQIAPAYPGFDGYWQKDMCMHWDKVDGCTQNQTDCDRCTHFKRIKPQYCKRCGGTFYQRSESDICEPCRIARKKQAQRKWAILHQKGVL